MSLRSCAGTAQSRPVSHALTWPRVTRSWPATPQHDPATSGYESVTTHIFVEGDPYLESDAVFGVKDSLIVPFVRHDDAGEAARLGLGNPYYAVEYDFVLVRSPKEP